MIDICNTVVNSFIACFIDPYFKENFSQNRNDYCIGKCEPWQKQYHSHLNGYLPLLLIKNKETALLPPLPPCCCKKDKYLSCLLKKSTSAKKGQMRRPPPPKKKDKEISSSSSSSFVCCFSEFCWASVDYLLPTRCVCFYEVTEHVDLLRSFWSLCSLCEDFLWLCGGTSYHRNSIIYSWQHLAISY